MLTSLSTGDRRFRLPEALPEYTSSITAKSFGPSCPQQAINLPIVKGLAAAALDWLVNTLYLAVLPDDEDCTFLLLLGGPLSYHRFQV